MSKTFETDIVIIGAGPVGLFTVFEAGLIKLKCHLIDSLPVPGGQLAEIYPKKPIYDIPGFPEILAGDLVENLMEQIAPFKPAFTLGEKAEKLDRQADGKWCVTTNLGTKHIAPNVVIAGGLGVFTPRKPQIPNIASFEDAGVDYMIKDPEKYRDKTVVISGGGDSALDWSIFMADVARDVYLIHRRTAFRGALDSVEKVMKLAEAGKIHLVTNAEVDELIGDEKLSAVGATLKGEESKRFIDTDYFIPLFGLKPTLGPIADWNLDLEKDSIKVDTTDYSTNQEGVYAIGDINTYPGKLKLILCGFHEGTIMVQSAFKRIYPDKNLVLKYTTVNGVNGFD